MRNENMPIHNTVSLDWCGFTIPQAAQKSAAIVERMQRAGFVLSRSTHGRNGYDVLYKSLQFPGFNVCYSTTREDMGFHVDISGSQLAILPYLADIVLNGYSSLHVEKIDGVLKYIEEKGTTEEAIVNAVRKIAKSDKTTFSRLDVAFDLVESDKIIFTPRELYEHVKTGQYTSSTKNYSFIESPQGDTFYLGRRTQGRFMRCYDKAAQKGIDGYWTRLEFELKEHHVDVWADRLCEVKLSTAFRELLDSTIRLQKLDCHDKCSTRRPTDDRWELVRQLAGQALRPFRLLQTRAREFSQRTVNWIEHTLSRTLARYALYKRGNMKNVFSSSQLTIGDILTLYSGGDNSEALYDFFHNTNFDLSHYDFSACVLAS